jgi:hypothetical protein
MTAIAGATIAVHGIDGFFVIVACLCFFAAAIAACIQAPRNWWAVGIAAGLWLWVLSLIFT